MGASLFANWQNFYVIIGSASAGLTGLTFVSVTLIAGMRGTRTSEGIAAFGSPTLLHFCAALFISAMSAIPWGQPWNVAVILGSASLASLINLGIVTYRLHNQQGYQPVLEDWIWHMYLPIFSYLLLLGSAIFLLFTNAALYGIAAVALMLLFIGIHNAWDTVVYIAIDYSNALQDSKPE